MTFDWGIARHICRPSLAGLWCPVRLVNDPFVLGLDVAVDRISEPIRCHVGSMPLGGLSRAVLITGVLPHLLRQRQGLTSIAIRFA
jgi:hypothetical protein